MIAFDDFKATTTVLPQHLANELRGRYIQRFVNTDSKYFHDKIQTKIRYRDGYYYTGYLWDVLKHPELIPEPIFLKELEERKEVLVFWDLHSSEKIFTPNYWKFAKDAMLSLDSNQLVLGLEYLPEDLYIFDHSLSWSLIHTYTLYEDQILACYRAW